MARFGNEHRVFPLCGEAVVLGDHGPAIGQELYRGLAGIDHGFHGQRHSGAQLHARAGAAVMQDLRVFVEDPADAVTAIFANDRAALGFDVGLNRVPDIAESVSGLDGFDPNVGVILMAATNRPEILDPALLRPGRFDRQVVVSLPDIKGREKILKVHMKKSPVAPDVEIVVLAKGTPGFSGADLENLVNEAALLGAKRDKEKVDMADFEDAKDKVYMGLERKSKVIKEEVTTKEKELEEEIKKELEKELGVEMGDEVAEELKEEIIAEYKAEMGNQNKNLTNKKQRASSSTKNISNNNAAPTQVNKAVTSQQRISKQIAFENAVEPFVNEYLSAPNDRTS